MPQKPLQTSHGLEKTRRFAFGDCAGFELKELILLVTLVGLILAISSVYHPGHSGPAPITEAMAQIRSFETAIEVFRLDTGNYPTSFQDLLRAPASATNWHGPYLKAEIPLDPWKHEYIYQYPGTHTNTGVAYDLYSPGPDKNATNIIANWNLAPRPQNNSR